MRQYASLWLIQDFHKALKTGLGAERLQRQMAVRLFAAVALLSVVALALVELRERSRQQPDAAGLSTSYLRVLRSQRRRPLVTALAYRPALFTKLWVRIGLHNAVGAFLKRNEGY